MSYTVIVHDRGGHLRMTIPAAIRRSFGLRAGDTARWHKQRGENVFVITLYRRGLQITPRASEPPTATVAEGLSSMEAGQGKPEAVFSEQQKRDALVRRQLEFLGARAAKKMHRMLRENAAHIARPSGVYARFGVAPEKLRAATEVNKVIAYLPSGDSSCIYPLDQFASGKILRWAAEIISIVGNGDAALHFLWVRRRSLGWRSFAELLRGGRNHDRVVQRMIERAKRLVP